MARVGRVRSACGYGSRLQKKFLRAAVLNLQGQIWIFRTRDKITTVDFFAGLLLHTSFQGVVRAETYGTDGLAVSANMTSSQFIGGKIEIPKMIPNCMPNPSWC